jgi:hypothetical protein
MWRNGERRSLRGAASTMLFSVRGDRREVSPGCSTPNRRRKTGPPRQASICGVSCERTGGTPGGPSGGATRTPAKAGPLWQGSMDGPRRETEGGPRRGTKWEVRGRPYMAPSTARVGGTPEGDRMGYPRPREK